MHVTIDQTTRLKVRKTIKIGEEGKMMRVEKWVTQKILDERKEEIYDSQKCNIQNRIQILVRKILGKETKGKQANNKREG